MEVQKTSKNCINYCLGCDFKHDFGHSQFSLKIGAWEDFQCDLFIFVKWVGSTNTTALFVLRLLPQTVIISEDFLREINWLKGADFA